MRDDRVSTPAYVSYTRRQLLSLYTSGQPTLDVCDRIRCLGLRSVVQLRRINGLVCVRRYRGRRSGRRQRPLPLFSSVHNGISVVVGNRPTVRITVRRPPSVRQVHADRHSAVAGRRCVFGCLNIRSIANKLDDVLEVRRDQSIDVFFLVETWHDRDSVAFRRLRSDGYQVVDRPRPRRCDDTLATNHGGVAAVAVPGVRLAALDLGAEPASFEFISVRVVSGTASLVVILIYRTGPVTSAFFDELADLLDRVVSLVEPVFVIGDLNIRLDRRDDPTSQRFTELLTSYGLVCRVSVPTHNCGGLLDVVVSRVDLPSPSVDVVDVGLSDHRLLRWSASLTKPCPVYSSVVRRPWRQLDVESFRAVLLSSALSRPEE